MFDFLITLLVIAGSVSAGFFLPDIFFNELKSVKDLYNLRRLKPFDCESCLSFWLCLIGALTVTNPFVAILVGMIAYGLTAIAVIKYK